MSTEIIYKDEVIATISKEQRAYILCSGKKMESNIAVVEATPFYNLKVMVERQ